MRRKNVAAFAAGQESRKRASRRLVLRPGHHAELLRNRGVKLFVDLNHLAAFLQHQRPRREHRVGIARSPVLLRHADVVAVNDLRLYAFPQPELRSDASTVARP